jgi:hypothetical protein
MTNNDCRCVLWSLLRICLRDVGIGVLYYAKPVGCGMCIGWLILA